MQTCLAGGRVVLNSLSLSPFLLRAHPPGDSLCCFWATQRRKDITSYPIKYPYIKASINFFFFTVSILKPLTDIDYFIITFQCFTFFFVLFLCNIKMVNFKKFSLRKPRPRENRGSGCIHFLGQT